MWEQIRRFSNLDREARWMFVRAAVLLPLISVGLRVRGFRWTQAVLRKRVARPKGAEEDRRSRSCSFTSIKHRSERTRRMVRAAARRSLIKTSCLEESLALWCLLRRQGIEADLRIGARKIAAKFEAHAWVECDGEALNQTEDPHPRYVIFEGVASHLTEAR